nr:muscle M-line assembly protein unc-89-like [Ipomoea batatas]
MAEEAFEMEKMEPRGFSWRRNSTGNINTKISLVLPRYLSAPLASCHDNCKYGGKRSNNNSEEAARIPKIFSSKLSEEERLYMTEKKFAGILIKKQKSIFPTMIRQNRVLGHDNVKSVRRGKIVEETLLKDGDIINPRKLVVQYIVVEENKKDCTEVFDNTTIEEDTAANTPAAENVFGNNVKTLIGAFESVILLGRDGNPLPAAADNMFSNVKALISAFESVISQKLLAPNASQIEIN